MQPLQPPVREEIPIWLAALRGPAVRLAAEIADGVMGHPMWSLDWAVERMQPDLAKGLARGGRKREDIDLNLWLWCAPGVDEANPHGISRVGLVKVDRRVIVVAVCRKGGRQFKQCGCRC